MTGPQHVTLARVRDSNPRADALPGLVRPVRCPLSPPTSHGSPFSHSGNPDAGHCSPEVAYRRATTCGSGTCVEVAQVDAVVLVRDSKHPDGPVLRFSIEEWEAFLLAVEAGEFDLR